MQGHGERKRCSIIPAGPGPWTLFRLTSDGRKEAQRAKITLFSCRFELFKWLLNVGRLSLWCTPPFLSDCTLGVIFSQVIKHKYALKICINYDQPQVWVIDSLCGSVESSRDRWRFGLFHLFTWFFSPVLTWKSVQKHLLHKQIFGSCLHVFVYNIKVVEGILQLIFKGEGWTTSQTKANPSRRNTLGLLPR